jgi:hypothetical protein
LWKAGLLCLDIEKKSQPLNLESCELVVDEDIVELELLQQLLAGPLLL